MTNNLFETLVGAFVIIAALAFFSYAYFETSSVKATDKTYTLVAKFSRIDGINPSSDVKISGVKIGKVNSIDLDHKSYQAILKFNILDSIKIPSDSLAEIVGNGLLGEKYINIQAGADTDFLEDGGQIEFTQSSVSLESIIGKFMFGIDKKDAAPQN
jgi:phospholipid/cholesterol/gamma-HCH transport system substrate-binding protein